MIPLWKPDNETVNSDVFHVCPGSYAILFATGLKSKRVRASAEEIDGPQVICIERLAFPDAPVERGPKVPPAGACDYIEDWRAIEVPVTTESVSVDGCCWSLTNCNNLMTISIPGSYRAHLNDATAIGKAQLYVERYYTDTVHGITEGK